MPQKYVTVCGVATLVHHRGPTTLPGTPPGTERGATIVCCHDAGSDGSQFADLMNHLAVDHSPIAYDQPGHGRSGGLDSLGSIQSMVEHLLGLSELWSITDPILVGEGLGSAVALQAAVTHPRLASALVLIGGAGTGFDVADEIDRLAAITAGRARREFDRSGYAPETDRPVYQKAFASWVKTDPRATLGDRRAQGAWVLQASPEQPVMVVVGQHEDPDGAGGAERLVERLPAGSIQRLAGAGRRGVLEQPEALAGAITSFLAANGRGPRP